MMERGCFQIIVFSTSFLKSEENLKLNRRELGRKSDIPQNVSMKPRINIARHCYVCHDLWHIYGEII